MNAMYGFCLDFRCLQLVHLLETGHLDKFLDEHSTSYPFTLDINAPTFMKKGFPHFCCNTD